MPAMTIITWFLGPIGRYVGIAIIAATAYGVWDLKIRHAEDVRIETKQKIERQHAVEKGSAARAGAVKRFDAGRMRDDGFSRD